jgi:prophage regulatory protein
MCPVNSPHRILRLPEVMGRVGLRLASIYLHISKGSFPKPISLGARAVGWLESDIDSWIAARIEVTRRQNQQ